MNVVELLRLELRTRTPQSVASALSRLIHAGTIPAGAKLPTIREVASGLQMSPTQVGEAWTLLARAGVVRTEGRRGTFVGVERLEPASPRFWQASREVGAYAIDLGTGTPDSELLPDLGPALARLANTAMVSNYLEPATLPTLDRLLRANWADLFDPEAVVIVDGALDGLDRICRELVRYGDRVVVEDPALPTIFDVVESNGGIALGVGLDEEGVRPDELARALRSDPVLVILQPRAQNPTGVSMSPERAADLARLLRDSSAIVVEDDHTGAVASAPPVTLSAWLPTRTLHVSAFSKSHGPDLRLAAVAGPLPFISAVHTAPYGAGVVQPPAAVGAARPAARPGHQPPGGARPRRVPGAPPPAGGGARPPRRHRRRQRRVQPLGAGGGRGRGARTSPSTGSGCAPAGRSP
ncbi:MAG: PLP-dependent aminotransferase family protein [Acidimicrobiales bacterium]